MWDRLGRRTLAPSRRALQPGNRVLSAVTLVVLVAGIAFALYAVFS